MSILLAQIEHQPGLSLVAGKPDVARDREIVGGAVSGPAATRLPGSAEKQAPMTKPSWSRGKTSKRAPPSIRLSMPGQWLIGP